MTIKLILKICSCLLALLPLCSLADESVKAHLNQQEITYAPLTLADGSNLTLVTPQQFQALTRQLSYTVQDIHTRFSAVFGRIPKFSTSIQLLPEKDFFAETNAPQWTNALYFKNKIIIPIPATLKKADLKNIIQAVKHEYTHAIINSLSAGRCPGWLDEGLAQWAEGHENTLLRKALIKQLRTKKLISLKLLQGGFTQLEPELVPAAYAQSLYITRAIINHFGFVAFRNFFKALRLGYSQEAAFIAAFNTNEAFIEALSTYKLLKNLAK